MNCYEFKGGTGTASRIVEHAGTRHTVGVLVQANFGARVELRIAGVPVGELLADDNPMAEHFSPSGAGSVIAIVATDTPLLPHHMRGARAACDVRACQDGNFGLTFLWGSVPCRIDGQSQGVHAWV